MAVFYALCTLSLYLPLYLRYLSFPLLEERVGERTPVSRLN